MDQTKVKDIYNKGKRLVLSQKHSNCWSSKNNRLLIHYTDYTECVTIFVCTPIVGTNKVRSSSEVFKMEPDNLMFVAEDTTWQFLLDQEYMRKRLKDV